MRGFHRQCAAVNTCRGPIRVPVQKGPRVLLTRPMALHGYSVVLTRVRSSSPLIPGMVRRSAAAVGRMENTSVSKKARRQDRIARGMVLSTSSCRTSGGGKLVQRKAVGEFVGLSATIRSPR
jgi:hypothetical protein